jgi:hypothetical protein
MRGDFFGVGFRFPPSISPETGRFSMVGELEVVTQALRVLLRTTPGERLMRPDYGCDLRRYLFAPNTTTTRRLITEEVARAILRYEDRITLDGVDVTASPVEPAQVDIVVRYTLKRTGEAAALSETLHLSPPGEER